jgi:prepilin-type N-terminal cleavage/methylation domain-containing protein
MKRAPFHPRNGVTLIELLVTIAILGTISAVTTLAVRRIDQPRPDDPRAMLDDSSRIAVATGRRVLVRVVIDGVPAAAVISPDGSIVADSALRVERFTGRIVRAR